MQNTPVDVLVVGAGPGGLATALSAARHGARVLVVERRPGTSTHPRATGLNLRTMEIFRTWGVARAVRARAIRVQPDSATAATLVAPPRSVGRSGGYPSVREILAVSPALPMASPQDVVEPILADAVRRHGGEIRFDAGLEALEVHAGGVQAKLATGTRVTARFVVGADGTRSAVRAALGIGVRHLGTWAEAVSVLFRPDLAPWLPGGLPRPLTLVDEPQPAALVPLGEGRWVYFPLRFDGGRPEIPGDGWTPTIRAATGLPHLDPEVLDVQRVTLAAEVATTYRAGPGFLVGDAAHRTTPVGGVGLNAAVSDGHELGWKLAWAVRGLAGDALLDSHDAERGPAGYAVATRSLDIEGRPEDGLPTVLGDPQHYYDTTGTGNSFNVRQHESLRLIMDSLRYWVLEMHVDGFRFDLAAALAREFHSVDRLAAFFDLVNQDPVVSQVKLIAEPWDVGEGGYQVGGFPALWTEWNGKYRDTVRDFWRGEPASLGEFASRFTGSSDLYEKDNRRPIASINFVTAHDGFTLADLVSYNGKHNEANGEGNRDGESHNRSWNHGVEGPTDDGTVHALRERQKRNFIATLLLSQGVPMISHGDELGRTQGGNNNVYCQDNEISWVDWKSAREYSVLTDFTGEVAKLRAAHPVFRRRRFFEGRPVGGSTVDDIVWLRPDGVPMSEKDWQSGFARTLAVYLNGEGIPERDPLGERIVDDSFLLLFNGHHQAMTFTLPGEEYGRVWHVAVDTADPLKARAARKQRDAKPGGRLRIPARSLLVLQRRY